MLIIEDIKQLRKVHLMIRKRDTGTPEEFASILCVSRRKMYYLLDVLRDFGAQVAYSRTKHTFYYIRDFDLDISFRIKKLGYEEWQDISGGALCQKSVSSVHFFCTEEIFLKKFCIVTKTLSIFTSP